MADRKPLISGNWKMHHDHFEAIRTLQKLAYRLTSEDAELVDASIHPPFTDVRPLQIVIETDDLPIALGAQNCHWEDKGAFTGEVAPPMLAKMRVSYVICGHSERRELFAETDEDVNRKVKAILNHDMTPIMCCGETLEEREAGGAQAKVERQVRAGLEKVKADQVAGMVIAYEPIWAIGTGRTASSDDAQAMCGTVRRVVADSHGADAAAGVRVQYGGSVKPTNIKELMMMPDIDGALVGGASLDPDDFARIIQFRLQP
ncbi:MAG: triose-phosphate isomerase [Actinomycetia bacterium]|nr:triose-phosphate isomerase [Actinomycetes bacterium]